MRASRWGLCLVLLSANLGRAIPNPCQGASDGESCTGPCMALAHCAAGACIVDVYIADGTRCSSPDICTVSRCSRGTCVVTGPLICPASDACHAGLCDPTVGCAVIDICSTDLPTLDAAPADALLLDAALADLTGSSPDLATAPRPSGADLDASSVEPHVFGSVVGCSASGRSSAMSLLAVLLVGAWVRLRSRCRP